MTQKYTVTVHDKDVLAYLNGDNEGNTTFSGKTYEGFSKVDGGIFKGAFEGIAEGEKVIFYENELKKIKKEETSHSLSDAYIVLDISPRFQCVVLVTDDREKAEKMAKLGDDYVIIQQSKREYPDSWK